MQRLRRYEPKHSAQTSGKPPAHDCDRCATASFSSSKAQLGLPAQLSVQHPPSWGAMMPDEALQDECRKRYVQGVAARVRKHGVAFPGATAIVGGPPRKKARAQQKKRSAAALPGIGPQPKKARNGRRRRLRPAAPTREGAAGTLS